MAQNSRLSQFEAVNPDKIDPVPVQLTGNNGAAPGV